MNVSAIFAGSWRERLQTAQQEVLHSSSLIKNVFLIFSRSYFSFLYSVSSRRVCNHIQHETTKFLLQLSLLGEMTHSQYFCSLVCATDFSAFSCFSTFEVIPLPTSRQHLAAIKLKTLIYYNLSNLKYPCVM